jgi:2,3-bisphosphoglycerate-independent phosphoglycerate mutase
LPLVHCKPEDINDSKAAFTADLVNALTSEITRILVEHPISVDRKSKGLTYPNLVLLRGAG